MPTDRVAERDGEVPGGTARRSFVVAGWTLVSRITGVLRVLALGGALGPTFFGNAVQTSLVVPNLVYTVVAGALLVMVVIPTLVRVIDAAGPDRAVEVLGRITGSLLLGAAGLAVLLVCTAPLVAKVLTLGVRGPEAGRIHQLLVLLLVLVAPQVALYVLAALGVAAQQARGRFALSAAAPAVENLVVIGSVLLAVAVFGSARHADTVSTGFVVVLGAGATVAVGAHAGLQLLGAARVGLLARPRLGLAGDPDARAAVARLRGSVGVAAFPAAALAAALVVATTVPGGVLVVQVAHQVFAALSYLGPRAVAIAVLPLLSGISSRQDVPGYANAWRSAVFYTLAASLPSLVLLVAFAGPTASLLAWYEGEHGVLVAQFTGCLVIVAAAQLAGGLHDVGRQALFARLEHRVPTRASAFALAAALGSCLAGLAIDDSHRLLLLTGAVLAAETTAASIVLARLRSALRPEPMVDRRHLRVLLAGGLALVPTALAGRWALALVAPGLAGTVGMLLLIGVVALAGYAVTVRAFAPRIGAVAT